MFADETRSISASICGWAFVQSDVLILDTVAISITSSASQSPSSGALIRTSVLSALKSGVDHTRAESPILCHPEAAAAPEGPSAPKDPQPETRTGWGGRGLFRRPTGIQLGGPSTVLRRAIAPRLRGCGGSG